MDNLSAGPLWDLSLPPSLPALADEEFITLLQKQFGANNGFGAPLDDENDKDSSVPPTNNINPQNLTRIPIPRPVESPPSDDSSPSPHEASASRSRRESGAFDMDGPSRQSEELWGDDDPSLKRKADEDDLDDEPNYKNQHTSATKKSTASRRKSTGNPNVDESRLLKRKEQNRAAQRAFRERKERHVKDLEDKVAALEEKNTAALQENENLREVVSRLQSENMRLRQSSFTFSVPTSTSSGGSTSQSQEAGPSRAGSSEMQQDSPMNLFSPPPSTTTSTTASTHDSPESMFANDNTDGQLSFLGHNLFTINSGQQQQQQHQQQQQQHQQQQLQQQHTATADAMNMDLGFGPVLTQTPYTTIASNPLFMSFREPDMFDMMSPSQNSNQNQNNGQSFDFSQQLFGGWPDVNMNGNGSLQAFDLTNSLDELFGASYNNNGAAGLDFLTAGAAAKGSPADSLSPINHQTASAPTPGASSSSSGSSPSVAGSPEVSTAGGGPCIDKKKCTKLELARALAADGGSMFVSKKTDESSAASSPGASTNNGGNNSNNAANSKSNLDSAGGDESCDEFPPCKGLQLPKTQKNEQNVEVMAAWRRIRHDPKFQDVDINTLCSEFAGKARCDGCHVVIEPTGMQEILESVQKQKRAKQQSQLFSASNKFLEGLAGGASGGGTTATNSLNNPLNK